MKSRTRKVSTRRTPLPRRAAGSYGEMNAQLDRASAQLRTARARRR